MAYAVRLNRRMFVLFSAGIGRCDNFNLLVMVCIKYIRAGFWKCSWSTWRDMMPRAPPPREHEAVEGGPAHIHVPLAFDYRRAIMVGTVALYSTLVEST